MEVIHGINHIRRFKNPVVAIGVFDGVHRAHRRLLNRLVVTARRIRGTSVVLTFSPHPQRQDSLSSLEHRLHLFEELDIDVCIVLDFNRGFSRITAGRFISQILVKKIGTRVVLVGENFRFGKNAHADAETLKHFSRQYGFQVQIFKTIRVNGEPVSSTAIRKLIAGGKLSAAQTLLLRPVSVLGRVITGEARATGLGFPTANVQPHHEVLPPAGVYAGNVLFNNKKFPAIVYRGTRPTFTHLHKRGGARGMQLEVHIFSFEKNIYGKDLEVQFIKKIREEKKFASPLFLIKQIEKDINSAKKFCSPTFKPRS